MKRKAIWLAMSCLMVAALVLSSCASAVTEEEEVVTEEEVVVTEEEIVVTEEEVVVTEEEEVVTEEEGGLELSGAALQEALIAGKVVETEKPKYGGVINIATARNQSGFDDGFQGQNDEWTVLLSNEEMMIGDWTAGPAGTGEVHYRMMFMLNPKYWVNCLAESWEIIDGTTLIFHVREGVTYHDPALKPDNDAMALVNGREFVAADAVFNWERHWANPATYIYNAVPRDTDIVRVEAPDKYTAIIEATAPDRLPYAWQLAGDWTNMYPPEVIETYGDMSDWRNSVGTGPFYLESYVDGSGAVMKRNPDWWMTNQIGPGMGDQLPYLDGVNFYFMTDPSSRMAAMRTGKVDFLREVTWEDADNLKVTNPELNYVSSFPLSSQGVAFRVDNPDYVGYNDERGLQVRRALAMAIDQPTMAEEYYNGNAVLLYWPVGVEASFNPARTEIEDLPLSADGFDNKKLFGYYPDEAEALLDEAGYPGPDRMSLTLPVWSAAQIDLYSLVIADWEKIGVDLDLEVMEYAAYTSMSSRKTHADIFPPGMLGTYPFLMTCVRWGDVANVVMLNDPVVQEAYYSMMDAYFDWSKRLPLMKDVNQYIIDLAVTIQLPTPQYFVFWQPWVKNFHGEVTVGNVNFHNFTNWCWIDQDMKMEMTGK
ncbi:ABC transporter substrate-binding protein [Chloroflexota bacterium]